MASLRTRSTRSGELVRLAKSGPTSSGIQELEYIFHFAIEESPRGLEKAAAHRAIVRRKKDVVAAGRSRVTMCVIHDGPGDGLVRSHGAISEMPTAVDRLLHDLPELSAEPNFRSVRSSWRHPKGARSATPQDASRLH